MTLDETVRQIAADLKQVLAIMQRWDQGEPVTVLSDELASLTALMAADTRTTANFTRQSDAASAGASPASYPHREASQAAHQEGGADD